MTLSTRADLEQALMRVGRQNGWGIATPSMGYYQMRFSRDDDAVRVRFGPGGRIADVVVDSRVGMYRLSLPARERLEGVLSAPRSPSEDTGGQE